MTVETYEKRKKNHKYTLIITTKTPVANWCNMVDVR